MTWLIFAVAVVGGILLGKLWHPIIGVAFASHLAGYAQGRMER